MGRNDISTVTHRKCKRGQGRGSCRNGNSWSSAPLYLLCGRSTVQSRTLDFPLSPGPLSSRLVWGCRTGGQTARSQTQRSGNRGKGIFPSGPASDSFARPLQGYQGSQGVWGQFPVRSPSMDPIHKSLNSSLNQKDEYLRCFYRDVIKQLEFQTWRAVFFKCIIRMVKRKALQSQIYFD